MSDVLHNDNGPAIIYADGSKVWYKNSLCHREDGPAVEYPNETKYWYYNGRKICVTNNEEFLNWVKFKAFM